MSKREVPPEIIKNKAFGDVLEKMDISDLMRVVANDSGIKKHLPENICRIDPRDGTRVIYSEARALRPHDNVPEHIPTAHPSHKTCPICAGQTTPFFDVTPLSKGCTFFNFNLYPIISYQNVAPQNLDPFFNPAGFPVSGGHYLQWLSSEHDVDIHNLPQNDLLIVMKRLAAFEKLLYHSENSGLPLTDAQTRDGQKHYGWALIAKNEGYLVGGSLTHGHIQITHSDILPTRFGQDIEFLRAHHRSFADYILKNNPAELFVRDFPGNVRTLVPYFMRRPLELMILPSDTTKNYLHDCTDEELLGLGLAFQESARAVKHLMPLMGKEYTYNLIMHCGPIGGLYLEMLPYTQQIGGYEYMGLYVCQGTPHSTQRMYANYFQEAAQCSV